MVNFNPISYLLLDTIDRVLLYTKTNKLTIIVKTKTVSLFFIYLIVTNSSEPVGCIATVLSKSRFVAPILIATAKP